MKKQSKKSMDWYGISQRFSIRKYHFGAASVLLGTLLTLGLSGITAQADSLDSGVPEVSGVVEASMAPAESDDATFATQPTTAETDLTTSTPSTDVSEPVSELDESVPATFALDNSEGTDVSDDINSQIDIVGENKPSDQQINTVTPHGFSEKTGVDKSLRLEVDITIPKVTENDYFDVIVSPNVDFNGASLPNNLPLPNIVGGPNKEVIATSSIIEPRTLRYTFTNAITDLKNISASLSVPLFINKDYVPNSSNQTIEVTIGNNTKSIDVYVDYSKYAGKPKSPNGIANIDNVDLINNTLVLTSYYNPNKVYLSNREAYFYNVNNSQVHFDQETLDTLKVYRVKNGATVNESFSIDPNSVEDVTGSVDKKINQHGQLWVGLGQNESNATYIIQFKAQFDNSTDVETAYIQTRSEFQGDNPYATGTYWTWDNQFMLYDGAGLGDAEQEPGSFQEHHIYITKDQDGVEVSREVVDGATSEGRREESYKTGKVEKDGFTFVRTEQPVNDPTYNEDGTPAEGHYVPSTKQEITYVYEKVVADPLKQPGSFQEHHIYITKDQDGVEVSREVVDGATSEGRREESYKTGKVEKDGFTFVRTEQPVNDPTYNEDGTPAEGHYVPSTKQEITYVYEKVVADPLKQPGSFQEHHIYITKDQDGVEVSREVVDGATSEGRREESYKTGKVEKDGFTFVRTEQPVNNPTYNGDGTPAEGHYVPSTKQEITYVYEKVVADPLKQPGSFQEHHIYITKDQDGVEVSREVVDGATSEGRREESYKTGKVEKDGFTFVRTEQPVNDPTYNEDGTPAEGHYVPSTKQEITYVYEKVVADPLKQPGSFQEHHIYITKDQDGVEVSREVVDGATSEGRREESYKTGKVEKDGFTFVRTEQPVNNPTYNGDGTPAEGHYVPSTKQEITYVYEKVVADPLKQPGSFQEHHIYITKDQDGVEVSREVVDGATSEGRREESYKTGKVEKDGFTFVRTEQPVNNPTYNEDGTPAEGHYVPSTKQEITYVYEKVVADPLKQPGSFQEHHIYITKDQDGVEVSREVVDGATSEGRREESYKTGKVEKDGFTFVRTEQPVNDPTYNEDGTPAEGHYVPSTKQEITYVYEKVVADPLKQPGSFQEHHIYITKDQDGVEVSREVVDGATSEGRREESYKTGKVEKDGFTFVRTEQPVNNPTYNEDGTPAEGHYVPSTKQEITYVYEKVVADPLKQPGSFQEHHIYITKDQDGVEVSREVVDGATSEGRREESYKTGKVEKDGFTFVRTEQPVNNPTYNGDGTPAEGHYVPSTKQEITYVYEKVVADPLKQPGSFQEHHIYITKDQDGVEVSREVVDGATSEGRREESYKTGKVEKDGFTFVRTEQPVNNPTYNGDGTPAEGHYVPSTKQEITYVYEKVVADPLKQPGSFQEHHIYITKDQDGVEVSREVVDGATSEGRREESYKTGKVEKDGFTFVRTEQPVNNPTYNEDGTPAEGHYVPSTKQEITYVYEKVVADPLKQPGSFQEHHIYITKDQDGVEVSREVVDGATSEGRREESYKTGKVEKDGFTFVRTEQPVNNPTYNGDGTPAEGHYVPSTKQEITYVYEKVVADPLKQPGSFQEHHIYITKDQDGVEVSREVVDGATSEGRREESYKTGKVEKDGFTFVRTEQPVNNPTYNGDGTPAEGHYVPSTKQEITYVYEKVVADPLKQPGSFQEHHIYITKDQDGVEVSREVVDGATSEGRREESYKTGKVEKDGFSFVGTENPVNNPTYNGDGTPAEGHYVPSTKQEITYVYEKVVAEEVPNIPSTPDTPPMTPPYQPTNMLGGKKSEPTPTVMSSIGSHVDRQQLPQTGDGNGAVLSSLGALLSLIGLGLGSKKRRKED
ncbi:MucBP domain-containing protein [Streptococcus pluranimalium]|uniref:MucBP domain-containing protein n=1 Tax=Streptococcus pluranimalium TaxID=82348 RepID=UPI003F690391